MMVECLALPDAEGCFSAGINDSSGYWFIFDLATLFLLSLFIALPSPLSLSEEREEG